MIEKKYKEYGIVKVKEKFIFFYDLLIKSYKKKLFVISYLKIIFFLFIR
jgi:hypothetical protein